MSDYDEKFKLIFENVSNLIELAGNEPKNDIYKAKLVKTMNILTNLQKCNDSKCDEIIQLINEAKGKGEGEVDIDALLKSIEEKFNQPQEAGNRNKSSKNKKKKKKNKTKKRRRRYNKTSLAN